MTTLQIDKNEQGKIRVFSLSMTDEQAQALKDNSESQGGSSLQELALGAMTLNPAHVEVFPLSDLGDMSLPEYLIEGPGAPASQVEADRFKLSALEGWVMIVYSSAFKGAEQTLNPSAQLTLAGTYMQDRIDMTNTVDLNTPSAQPYSGAPPEKKRPSDAAMSGRIAMVALLVAFFVVALMWWVGS